MFYSQFILAKKGPLGTIWIAAHLERKLRKNQVADTDIGVSVDSILFPDVPIALRLSSHLLLGVVRIYSRKVNYLFDDCSDTLLKVKQAFRSTAVDLPPEESTAPYHSITLPETFDLDDFELPDNGVFQGNYVDHHISSKEQITLQDSMDGVVYSTSQFGLDERFGDGDASQIGLDLDEELFLEKLAAPGDGDMLNSNVDPQTSFQPITPFEEDENDEEMNQTSPAMAAHVGGDQDCAEAPSTPGLVQEPILCNVQKLLACDDHPETEDLNPKDREDNEDLQMTLDATLEENGYDLDVEEIQHLKPKGDLPATSENLEHLENGSLINNVANVDLSPRFSCEASQEDNCYKPSAVENITETFSSRSTTLDDQTVHTEVNNLEVAENVDKSFGPRNTLSPNGFCSFEPAETEAIVEDETCHKPKDCKTLETDEDIASPRVHVLQRCNSGLRPKKISLGGDSSVAPSDITNDTDKPCSLETSEMAEAVIASGMVSEMLDENCDPIPAVIVVPSVEEKLTPEMNTSEDKETDRRNLDAVPEDQSEFPNSSAVSDLPAPEKLLSMPEAPGNLLNEFLVEISPNKMVSVEREGDGTESRIKQGNKRSFTESTMTLQSHNADGLLTNAQSKRTADFIPDDDDLLSSILVGRKSSILKLKATPTVTEVGPRKRPRITPRASSSASKRKVLMDESMVLHGDTIRQQLTSTEDIRRVRKKAPATRHEVWIIEKQFLEEEVFYEPIFTGMTIDLIALHSEPYDLNNIKIIINENVSAVDSGKKAEPAGRPNVKKRKETEVTETSLDRINEEAQPAVIPVHDENQQGANSSIGLRDNKVQLQTDAISADIELRIPNHEHSEIADMEVDGVSVDVADEAGCTISHGLEYPCPSVHVDAPSSVDKDASVLDLRNGEEINDVHFREIPSENILECETEPDARGEQLVKGAEDYVAYDVRADCFTGSPQLTDNPELPITATLLDTDARKDLILVSNHSIEEIANGEPEFVQHGDGATEVELDGNTACDIMGCEDPKGDSFHLEESNVKDKTLDGAESTFLNDIERPSYLEAEVHGVMDLETSGLNHFLVEEQGGIGNTIGEHDTEFLNVDDDDIAEDDDYIPSAEETGHLENSGWSSRSRAVAKYLQTIFDTETEHGKRAIPMDNLLSGKTRKEASRMFFETLVLKTRDYIHVEQPTPFNNINIKPRGKLMKMDF